MSSDLASAETLHGRIRAAILALELMPGQRISERGLEPRFGASRTPIRAALQRLEAEGLVTRLEKGWSVSLIDLAEIRALSEYREILETSIVRLAAARASDADLAELVRVAGSARADETPEHSVDSGSGFHLELARATGNTYLVDAMDGVLTRLYRTRWLEVQDASSRERAHREHAALARALVSRDAVEAERVIVEHTRGTTDRLVRSLESRQLEFRASGIAVA